MDGSVDFEDMNTSLREISESMKVMKSKAPSAPEFLEAFTSIGAVKESEREVILADSDGPSLNSYIAKMRNYETPMNVISIFRKINTLFYFPLIKG